MQTIITAQLVSGSVVSVQGLWYLDSVISLELLQGETRKRCEFVLSLILNLYA